MKIFTDFYDWKQNRMNEIKTDESFAICCNKTMIKLTTILFNQENILNKIKNNMFAKMKRDMKSLIEYEFEFQASVKSYKNNFDNVFEKYFLDL